MAYVTDCGLQNMLLTFSFFLLVIFAIVFFEGAAAWKDGQPHPSILVVLLVIIFVMAFFGLLMASVESHAKKPYFIFIPRNLVCITKDDYLKHRSWMQENMKHSWRWLEESSSIAFYSKKDALLFKLTWYKVTS